MQEVEEEEEEAGGVVEKQQLYEYYTEPQGRTRLHIPRSSGGAPLSIIYSAFIFLFYIGHSQLAGL